VFRFVRFILSDDLAPDPEEVLERAERLLESIACWNDAESESWTRIVESARNDDLDALRDACMTVGGSLASQGELESGIEALAIAYDLSVALGDAEGGAETARRLGRAHRNAGRWDDSESWYGCSVSLAQVLDDAEREAIALDGWANTARVRGAFPAARRHLDRALGLARRSGSGYAMGSVHQGLMTLSALAGEHGSALDHGWSAVEAYETERDQLRALVTVAGLLLELEEADLAERAYSVALRHLQEPYFRLFALDGHAHAAALRGDREVYEERSRQLDAEDWRVGGPDFEGQVHLYRGRAWQHLGALDLARTSYMHALAFAESHGLTKTLFEVQGRLDQLDASHPAATTARLDHGTTAAMAGRLERVDRLLAGAST
jgi:tetratricopeptide (TPR) repeat protein